jgi:hypothetical protein
MTALFDRRVALTIAKPRGLLDDTGANAVVVTDLRVEFRVDKSLSSEPNTCSITVYNLAERTRSLLQDKPTLIRLDAGYEGSMSRLFVGDLVFSESMRTTADWESRLQVADGSRAYKARVNRGYARGVQARDALREIAQAMGTSPPRNIEGASELLSSYSAGLVLDGPAHSALTKLLGAHGLEWSIQDGHLQILRPNDVRPDQAVLVSQETGMIGTPEHSAPKENGGKPTLSVQTLLDPRIHPGGRIALREPGRLYKVERVSHTGDSHAEAWETHVEAVAR